MFITSHHRTGGRFGARRFVAGLTILAAVLFHTSVSADDDSGRSARVHVDEHDGVYVVSACFRVPQPRGVVRGVLTDYERIPRFMPGVKTSIVVERAPGHVVVQQEALSRFMMFSKRVYLLLDVTEQDDVLAFTDRSARSFRRYEGSWTLADVPGGTDVTYRLTAEPSFDVPQMILKRLLGRDSAAMIDGLRGEMAARGATAGQ
jgi:hypothetical protein